MKIKPLNQKGFLPMLVLVFLIVAAAIYFVFTRVLHAEGTITL